VALNVVTLAFLVVASTCAMLIPVMLYIFWLKPSGWQWYDAALFGSIIASTDAVAIVAVLKKSAHLYYRCPASAAMGHSLIMSCGT
jgi:NhaP-type Na+/H+ or K+/H+ antiporter